ncbi:putative methyltransferase-domain-containing protein [Pelagophyceae sp. CCMP2097]|nr:putative methyltransferase-domain-containing protein [Pelagophyceae sp. CCMP2097]
MRLSGLSAALLPLWLLPASTTALAPGPWRVMGFELYEGAPAGAESASRISRAALASQNVLGGATATAPVRAARRALAADRAPQEPREATVRFRFDVGGASSPTTGSSLADEPLDLILASFDAEGIGRSWECQVWESAVVLALYLRSPAAPALFGGTPRRVLELGAGVGLPGIDAARRGATRVTLTDNDDLQLGLLAANAARSVASCQIDVLELDWADGARRAGLAGLYDVVVAADVCYEEASVAVLARLLFDVGAPLGLVVGKECSSRGPWLGLLAEALRGTGARVEERMVTLLRGETEYDAEADATVEDVRATKWDATSELASQVYRILVVSREPRIE